MPLKEDAAGAIVGPIVAVIVIFRLTGKHGDVEDLLRVTAPWLFVTHLAVSGSDDFVGGRIEFS